jgi:pyruvate/2-oxoglutarate dehydrogenase complex dihydrolipoamide dehydrogenase (E3) component
MSSSDDCDVILLGGGAPGERCAAAPAARGLSGAVVERELVGGECSYWACIPSKSLLRPGQAVHGAREAGARAEIDAEAPLAWRDFMVSGYPHAGQERWLAQQRHRPAVRGAEDRRLHARIRRIERVPDAAQRRRSTDRRLRARARSR